MEEKTKVVLSQIWNIAFYIILALVVLYFIKRKFVVPKLETQQLILKSYNTQEVIDFQKMEGKIVVLNFWQTWCGPCLSEMPSLNEMNGKWNDIEVYAISNEPYAKIANFETSYPHIHFVQIAAMSDAGITQFPTTYILNKKGVKVFNKIGGKDWSDDNFIAMLKTNWDDE